MVASERLFASPDGAFEGFIPGGLGGRSRIPTCVEMLVYGSWKSLPALVRRCSDPGPTCAGWCRYRALTRPFYLRERFRLAFERVPSLPVKPGIWCCHRSSSTLVKMGHLGSHGSFCGSAPRPIPSKGDRSARPKLGFEAEPLACPPPLAWRQLGSLVDLHLRGNRPIRTPLPPVW